MQLCITSHADIRNDSADNSTRSSEKLPTDNSFYKEMGIWKKETGK